MATAEERDQMKATIARLESRVAQLEATLAAVLAALVVGVVNNDSSVVGESLAPLQAAADIARTKTSNDRAAIDRA